MPSIFNLIQFGNGLTVTDLGDDAIRVDVAVEPGVVSVPTMLAYQFIACSGYMQPSAGTSWGIQWSNDTANHGSATLFTVTTNPGGFDALAFLDNSDFFFFVGTRFGNPNVEAFEFSGAGTTTYPTGEIISTFVGQDWSIASTFYHHVGGNAITPGITTTDSGNPDGGLGWAGGTYALAIQLDALVFP